MIICLGLSWTMAASGLAEEKMPATFVDVSEEIRGVFLDIRYFGDHNFLGTRVDGYLAAKCLLTKPAAQALAGVQKDLAPYGLALKIYDCYRPQRAVDHFVRWAKDIDDIKTKKEFYPTVDKRHLFRDGYIDSRSSHSRGSTVDLTIVSLPLASQPAFHLGQEQFECYLPVGMRYADNSLDMGTGFDCFHERSHTANPHIPLDQRISRLLLKTLMEKHGFRNYDKEWWHYTLNREPYPDTYFNFPVK
jgi:D-alanyl-D-alanine dipeptidase